MRKLPDSANYMYMYMYINCRTYTGDKDAIRNANNVPNIMSLIACLFQFHEQDTDSIYSPLPIQPKWLGQGYVLITVWTEVKVYTYFIYNSHTREHTPTLL